MVSGWTSQQSEQLGGDGLSHTQRLIWAGQQLHPDVPLYNMAFAFTIRGALDPETFQDAFGHVVEQSDALRSVFIVDDGVPVRRLLDGPFELPLVDWSAEDLTDADVMERLRDWAVQPFDPGNRLFDSALIELAPDRFVWYFSEHHIIADAWSMGLLYRRTAEAYRAILDGTTPPGNDRSYQELVEFERSEVGRSGADRARAHWTEQLRSVDAPPALYGGRRRDGSTASARITRTLSTAQSDALRALSEHPDLSGLTPDMKLFNAFATVLMAWMWRVSGQRLLTIGCLAHNRGTPSFKDTPGVFIELFPLAAGVEPDDTFASLNARVGAESLRMLQHAHSGASLPEFNQSFNVVLNFITAKLGAFDGLEVNTTWLHTGHADQGHHVRLQVHDFDDTGRYELLFDFNEAVFDATQRVFAVDHILALLDALAADPTDAIALVPLTGHAEQRLLHKAAGAEAEGPAPGGTTVSRFASNVARHPHRVAVVAAGEELTYEELDQRSSHLAQRLRALGAGPDDVVALFTGRTVEMIVGILGIQKAGAAYLPLDAEDPPDRRSLMLDSSSALAVVVDAGTAARLEGTGRPLVKVSESEATEDADAIGVEVEPHHLAYVLFTSGSTGVPKAVTVEHSNVVALVDGLRDRIYRDLGGSLRVALVAPYVFDPSVQQIFAALLLGHSLFIVPERDRSDGDRLHEFYLRHAIVVTDGTPAHMRLLLDGSSRSLDQLSVQHYIIGGETMPKRLARRFLTALGTPQPTLTNIYGPAECTVDCIEWSVLLETLDDYDTVPIGTPLRGERAYVLDGAGQPAPIGVVGELHLGGTGVGRGYLDDAGLTAERFAADPYEPGGTMYRTGDLARVNTDGLIEFSGRIDTQVKVRGHRIELGEIESALRRFRIQRTVIPFDALGSADEPARCSRCLLTQRHPGVTIGADGVCSVCRDYDQVEEAIGRYFRPIDEFASLVERAGQTPDSRYDCLLLYSGGKDSSYVLYRLAEMGLSVLAYTFDNGHISQAAFRNIERQTSRLGVDSVVTGTAQMDEIFLESLNDDSTVCSGCFRALTSISTRLAGDEGINVVVTGLSRGQIFDTKLAGLVGEGVVETTEIERQLLLFRKGYHARRDRTATLLGVDLSDVALDDMAFVDFFRYDATPTAEIHAYLKERDTYWQQPEDTGFCSSNCMMNDVGIAVHSANEGYHNYEAPLSWDIRLGVADRDDALAEVQPIEKTRYVSKVLSDIGYLSREVTDAVVVVQDDDEGGRQIHAYYVATQSLTVPELRSFLSRTLPDYMIPARFIQVDEIPLTANGKVDREALTPDVGRPELGTTAVAPTTATERLLVDIWADVLGVDLGVHDSFFELGGDSIHAIRIVARAREAGLEITATQLFETLTVAGLAAVAEAGAGPATDPGLQHGSEATKPFELVDLDQDELDRLSSMLE